MNKADFTNTLIEYTDPLTKLPMVDTVAVTFHYGCCDQWTGSDVGATFEKKTFIILLRHAAKYNPKLSALIIEQDTMDKVIQYISDIGFPKRVFIPWKGESRLCTILNAASPMNAEIEEFVKEHSAELEYNVAEWKDQVDAYYELYEGARCMRQTLAGHREIGRKYAAKHAEENTDLNVFSRVDLRDFNPDPQVIAIMLKCAAVGLLMTWYIFAMKDTK